MSRSPLPRRPRVRLAACVLALSGAALLVAGFVGGLLVPGHWGEVAVGVYAGQALVLLGRVLSDTGSGVLWPLGLMVLGLYSLIALAGALLGSALRRFANRRR